MNRTLRSFLAPLLCATPLLGAGCAENPQSVYIVGFLRISQTNDCKVTTDSNDFAGDELVDTEVMRAVSPVGYIAALKIKNGMISTASGTAVERNTIFPTAIEVELKASPGQTLPPVPGLTTKYSIRFPFPAVEPGGFDVGTLELVPKETILAAANNLGTAGWDGILVASTKVAYTHNNETRLTPSMDFKLRLRPGSLGAAQQPCPIGGFQSNQVQKACFPGQDTAVTCCTQGNVIICGDSVPVGTGDGG